MKQITIFAFVCIFLFLAACSEPAPPTPVAMQGTWITDDERYENRYIEIRDGEISMGSKQTQPNLFFILKTQSKKIANTMEYTFFCEMISGDKFELSFIFHPDEYDPWLQLKNTPQIQWYRKPI